MLTEYAFSLSFLSADNFFYPPLSHNKTLLLSYLSVCLPIPAVAPRRRRRRRPSSQTSAAAAAAMTTAIKMMMISRLFALCCFSLLRSDDGGRRGWKSLLPRGGRGRQLSSLPRKNTFMCLLVYKLQSMLVALFKTLDRVNVSTNCACLNTP